jgi:uncharacterized protein (DUF1697 family)
MSLTHYCALLRGINVGGNNIIKMSDLKSCFESMGLTNVSTYIQSGNVLFSSEKNDKSKLVDIIEAQLSKEFEYQSKIVLIAKKQLETVIKKAPDNFGTDPEKYRYDVVFLKEPLTAVDAVKSIKSREGVDTVTPGKDVLYFSRVIELAGKSYLTKIISLPIYKNMTIRNWNTTSTLFDLMK